MSDAMMPASESPLALSPPKAPSSPPLSLSLSKAPPENGR